MSTGLAIRRIYDRCLAPLDLTLPDAMLLALVVESGPWTQVQLARALDSGRAVTGVRIDGLVSRGAVERHPDPSDRRVWLIQATAEGRRLVGEINRIDREVRERIRLGTTREERRAFALTAARLRANIDKAIADNFMPSAADNTA